MTSAPVTDAERLTHTQGDVHSVKGLPHALGLAVLNLCNPAQIDVLVRMDGWRRGRPMPARSGAPVRPSGGHQMHRTLSLAVAATAVAATAIPGVSVAATPDTVRWGPCPEKAALRARTTR
ncbi:hypothetical protein [Streptomyces sp. NPDC048825]|uniref:hypothetical protein n=1 Tax=Streptomyces sp. NPDC048825 TaxID=3365592 RepID=UPI003715524A